MNQRLVSSSIGHDSFVRDLSGTNSLGQLPSEFILKINTIKEERTLSHERHH
jgi:hypothetical protein